MKVKYFIALALSHGAKLLIMDEPTSGLDPLSREEFCDLILKVVKEEGVSVLFSTHITSDLMRVADDIVYIGRRRGARRGGDRGTFGKIRSRLFCRNAEGASRRIERSQKRIRRADRRGAPSDCAARRPADLDALMIHLETARKKEKECPHS